MACAQQMHMFDDGDAMFLGDGDLFGDTVPCIAGELELQVQSYEGAGYVPVGVSSARKSFSLTKDSGGSSLSALAAADFGDADFMDNVSLDDLAAADHYGHTICGRQSTADSAAAACTGRPLEAANNWNGVGVVNADPSAQRLGLSGPDNLQAGQESSDCDMSHTHGDGESSGVGPGKSVALGSSHSEASEDNTAGVAPNGAARDEEHISMPSFGLSLSRLTHNGAQSSLADDAAAEAHPTDSQTQRGQRQQQQQTFTAEQQRMQMTRAFSVDNFALTNGAGGGSSACPDSSAPASHLDGLRRAHVYRSYSYISPDTLPMDFVLGCGDSGSQFSLGARGRCASLNETQLRRQWLREGELLAPQLPPSVSELELLELPEDSIPVRPSSTGRPFLGQHPKLSGASLVSGSGARTSLASGGLMQFKGSNNGAAGSSPGAGAGAPAQGVTVTVKRKIITSPSPLLQQSKPTKTRQAAAAAAAAAPGAAVKGQSPKRVKLASSGGAAAAAVSVVAWSDGAALPSSAGVLAGWQPPRQAGAGLTGGMKSVRSMPANMNSFMDDVEVTVQPLGPTSTLFSPDSSNAAAPAPCARDGTFLDPSGAGNAVAGRAAGAAAGPQAAAVTAVKVAKSKAAAVVPHSMQPAGAVQGVGMGGGTFVAPGGMLVGPDGKRLGPVPSVPKPRKRASPNGNPPKAPAPNPNGHCCTQCGTQTTPVWRAGPHGPKTLCNACGVRYMKVAKGNVAPTPRRQQH